MQSNKNKNNIFIQKENTHNIMSTFFFSILFLFFIILLILSIFKTDWILSSFLVISEIIIFIKILIQIKIMISFNKLTKNINSNNLSYYITKSWTRKRESSVWVGISTVTITIYFLILQIIFSQFNLISKSIFTMLIFSFIIISAFIVMYINIQIIDGHLKLSLKRIDLDSVEWRQIKKEQNIFYKTIYIWIIHLLFILPILLFVIKPYREMWNKILKN